MKTLEQQIAQKCKHFTGIMNESCRVGVRYDSVRGEKKPFEFPCIHPENDVCPKREYLTNKQVQKRLEEMKSDGLKALAMMAKVKKEFKSTRKRSGTVPCECGGTARFTIAGLNDHAWIGCPTCKLSLME